MHVIVGQVWLVHTVFYMYFILNKYVYLISRNVYSIEVNIDFCILRNIYLSSNILYMHICLSTAVYVNY